MHNNIDILSLQNGLNDILAQVVSILGVRL